MSHSKSFIALIFFNAFVIGFIVMGFEMLSSRYMNPYFGSGIDTWAAIISAAMTGLMIGYFSGGVMADRFHSCKVLSAFVIMAAGYLAIIPSSADHVFTMLTGSSLNDTGIVIVAALWLLFLPVTLLGIFTPYAIRLILQQTHQSGRVSGRLYGVSTFGNITGIMTVTFYLIPMMGSRHITYLLAGMTVVSGLSLLIAQRWCVAGSIESGPGQMGRTNDDSVL